jgi:hypothetical protein
MEAGIADHRPSLALDQRPHAEAGPKLEPHLDLDVLAYLLRRSKPIEPPAYIRIPSTE